MSAGALVVDVTRIVSRLGRGALTGIDRVELAYIRHIPHSGVPSLALLRTAAGVVLLRPQALGLLAAWAEGGAAIPDRCDVISRLTQRHNRVRGRAETALRGLALRRAPLLLAGPALRRSLPGNTVYLNTGHANLSDRMMRALHAVPDLRIAVLVHDTIPLDHPHYARPDQIAGFGRKMAAVSAHADMVIHTAQVTRSATEAQLFRLGRVPPGLVAPLGVDVTRPDPAALPAGLDLSAPYFVAVGTIEPRKNHALLLDVWDRLAAQGPVPQLFIVGNRGWADPALLGRLDLGVRGVTILSGLNDAGMMALVAGARALLFPSLAEGYGLPPLEAASLGTTVVSTPLSVIREGLGDYPVYADATDRYSWMERILALLNTPAGERGKKKVVTPPNWRDHFKTVLNAL